MGNAKDKDKFEVFRKIKQERYQRVVHPIIKMIERDYILQTEISRRIGAVSLRLLLQTTKMISRRLQKLDDKYSDTDN